MLGSVPSLPTFSIASEIILPISSSPFAESVATCAISSADFTFLESFAMPSTTAAVAVAPYFALQCAPMCHNSSLTAIDSASVSGTPLGITSQSKSFSGTAKPA